MRMVSVAYKYVSVYRSLLNMNRNEERVYVCMRVCIYACMRVCVYACMRVCVYACMPSQQRRLHLDNLTPQHSILNPKP